MELIWFLTTVCLGGRNIKYNNIFSVYLKENELHLQFKDSKKIVQSIKLIPELDKGKLLSEINVKIQDNKPTWRISAPGVKLTEISVQPAPGTMRSSFRRGGGGKKFYLIRVTTVVCEFIMVSDH